MAFQFVFDPNRCTGCQACVVGCWMENRSVQAVNWRQVHTYNAFRHPGLPLFHLSLACHHCEDPACLRNCPADAYTKDAATGAVTIHAERCIGCRYCTWACTYDAPKFNPVAGTIEKCTFCPERIGQGQEPACVARCPVDALGFEPLSAEARHQDLPGFPASEIRPAIRFVPLRRKVPPELGVLPEAAVMAGFLDRLLVLPTAKITLRGEWTLVLFTTVLAVLAAWFTAALAGGPGLPPGAFLGLGLPAMVLSAWHLGRRARAWRAILHLRTSWLSREIALTGAFLGLGGLHLLGLRLLGVPLPTVAWAAAAAGWAGLFAIDRIYRVALRTGPWNLHSGQALLNGLYLLGMLGGWPLLALPLGLVKLALYAHRKRGFACQGHSPRLALSLLRVSLGFGMPAFLFHGAPLLAALSAVLGDFVDRCEFYDELDIPTPQGDLTGRLRERLRPGSASGSAG